MLVDPSSDFSFDRLAQHPLGSLSKDSSQHVLGTDGWKSNDWTGRLGHRQGDCAMWTDSGHAVQGSKARLNHVDVLLYLTDVLRHLPAVAANNKAGLDPFLPYRWLAAHPEHQLVGRERESRQTQTRRKIRRAARRAASEAAAASSH